MAKYKDPNKIFTPTDAISKVDVIYDDHDTVSMAKIKWFNRDVLGIRWNIGLREWSDPEKMNGAKECVGVPTSRGYPTWFILPDDILDAESELQKKLRGLQVHEKSV